MREQLRPKIGRPRDQPEEDKAKARKLWYKHLVWLGVIRPLAQGEDWPLPLWQTFSTTTIGFPLPLLCAAPGQSKSVDAGNSLWTSLAIMLAPALLTLLRRLLMTGPWNVSPASYTPSDT